MDVNVTIGSNRLYILATTLTILAHRYVLRFNLYSNIYQIRCYTFTIYRAIHKSLRDFRTLRYSSRDGHTEGERVNRGTDTPSFCPTLQVLDKSTLGDAADVNPDTRCTCVAGT